MFDLIKNAVSKVAKFVWKAVVTVTSVAAMCFALYIMAVMFIAVFPYLVLIGIVALIIGVITGDVKVTTKTTAPQEKATNEHQSNETDTSERSLYYKGQNVVAHA